MCAWRDSVNVVQIRRSGRVRPVARDHPRNVSAVAIIVVHTFVGNKALGVYNLREKTSKERAVTDQVLVDLDAAVDDRDADALPEARIRGTGGRGCWLKRLRRIVVSRERRARRLQGVVYRYMRHVRVFGEIQGLPDRHITEFAKRQKSEEVNHAADGIEETAKQRGGVLDNDLNWLLRVHA